MKGEEAISYHALMCVLRGRVGFFESQRRAARTFGVSEPYLSDVLNGRREPAGKLLRAIGYERLVLYRKLPLPGGEA